MKKFLAVLSTAAIMTTSFSAFASDEALSNIMSKFDDGKISQSQSVELSKELNASMKSGDVTTADLKRYLNENLGPKAARLNVLIDKAEAGEIDKSELQAEFQKAVKGLGDGAHFKASRDTCDSINIVSFIVLAGSGIATLVYGIDAISKAEDMRKINVDIAQAQLKIQQIQNDPTIPSYSSSSSASGTTSSTGGGTTTTTTTTTTTYTPPTKSELIAQQQRVINQDQIELVSKRSEYDSDIKFTEAGATGAVLGGTGLLIGNYGCDSSY